MAYDMGFKELASKSESYEICFIPDNDYRGFLKRKKPGLEDQLADGNFVRTNGEIIGKHRGYPSFIQSEQRRGL
jgi:tRNA-specific 2-thiouridylase